MSQKKLKKIRRVEVNTVVKEEKTFLPKFWDIIKNNWIFLSIMTVLGILLYANAQAGNFVSDDYGTITQNTKIGDFWFTMNWNTFGNSMNLSNYIVFKLFGNQNPMPYHLMSLLWFLVFNILAYVFVRIVTKSEMVAKLSMLLFVFHPIHVEAVSWIAGRIYLIIATYVMASVINFLYFLDTGKYKSLILSGVFFLLAFSTDRPRPFAVFLIILLYVTSFGFREIIKRYLKFFMVAGVVLIIAFIISWPYITTRIAVVNGGINASDGIFYNPLFQYPTAIPNYLQKLFFPVDLTLYHTMYVLPLWLNWAILINYLALMIYFFVKDKRYFFSLAFIFVAIAPSMSPVKVSWLVAERYMFLGSLGFCMFFGLLLDEHWKKLRFITPTILFSFIVFFAVRTFVRNEDWSTNHNLWVNTCQVSPNSHNAWNNIGDDYDKLKEYDNAVKGFTQSVLVKPNYADAYHNRANIFYKAGRLDLARESYEIAIKFSPNLYQTYLSLTQIDVLEKKFDLAIFHATKSVQLQPGDPQAMYVLGYVNAQIGNTQEAIKIFKAILTNYPNFLQARNALLELTTTKVGNS